MILMTPSKSGAPQPIRLRIQTVGQLFHTLDPLPFRERDLDTNVEEYVTGWAGEMPARQPLDILLHLPAAEAARAEGAHIEEAIQHYFAYRADVIAWTLRDLFRTGRVSLAIGLAVLAVCIVLGSSAAAVLGEGYVGRFFDEGLIILGWVANWRPIEILLYEWWPIVGRWRLYRRLAVASVRIVADGGP